MKNSSLFILLTCILLTQLCFAQSNQEIAKRIESYSEARIRQNPTEAQQELAKLLENELPDSVKALGFGNLGMSFGYAGDWGNARKNAWKAFHLYEKAFGEGDKRTIDELYNVGYTFYDFDSLLFCWEKCVKLYEKYQPEAHTDLGLVHNNLGTNCRSRGLPQKTLKHFRKAVFHWERMEEENQNLDYLITGYDNLGAYLTTSEGLYYLQKALNLKLESGKNPFRSYVEIAGKYNEMEQFQPALANYRKGIQLLQPLAEKQKPNTFDYQWDLAVTYGHLASVFESLERYDSAVFYYDLALSIPTIQKYDYKRLQLETEKASALYELSRENGRWDLAREKMNEILEEAIEKKVRTFGFIAHSYSKIVVDKFHFLRLNTMALRFSQDRTIDYAEEDIFTKFPANSLPLSLNSAVLLSARADGLLEYWEYQSGFKDNEKKASQIMEMALFHIEEALRIFEKLRESSTEYVFFKRKMDEAIGNYQAILFAQYESSQDEKFLRKAFEVSEMGKINTALLGMNTLEAKDFTNLPEEVFEREQRLKSEISRLETKIFNEKQKNTKADSEKIAEWNNQIFEYNKEQKVLSAEIAQKYPDYFQLRKSVKPISVAEIQAELEEGTCVLAYSYDDDNLFRYLITKDEFVAQRVSFDRWKNDSIRGNVIELYISSLRSNLENPQVDVEEYLASSELVVQFLLDNKDGFDRQLLKNKKVIVIPDKMISLIPFEALVGVYSSAKTYAKIGYLSKYFEISYAYSATLWKKQNRIKNRNQENFWAGFAPNYANFNLSSASTPKFLLLYKFQSACPGQRLISIVRHRFREPRQTSAGASVHACTVLANSIIVEILIMMH